MGEKKSAICASPKQLHLGCSQKATSACSCRLETRVLVSRSRVASVACSFVVSDLGEVQVAGHASAFANIGTRFDAQHVQAQPNVIV